MTHWEKQTTKTEDATAQLAAGALDGRVDEICNIKAIRHVENLLTTSEEIRRSKWAHCLNRKTLQMRLQERI